MNYLKVAAVVLVLMLSGCSSKSVDVKESDTQLMSKSDKAYIVFSWPKDRIYNPEFIELAELNKKQDDFKFIGAVEFGNKIIYEVTPGKHDFYGFVDGGLAGLAFSWISDDVISVDAQAGQVYFVWIDSDAMDTKPKFVEFDAHKDSLYDTLVDKECSTSFLSENNFKQIISDEEVSAENSSDLSNEHIKNYKSDSLDLEIVCKHDVAKRPDSMYMTTKELIETTTVTMSKDEKAKFVKNRAGYLARVTDENRKKVQKEKIQKEIDKKEGIAVLDYITNFR